MRTFRTVIVTITEKGEVRYYPLFYCLKKCQYNKSTKKVNIYYKIN